MPLYGNELDRSTNPYEAGLGRVVKLAKPGDFVGRAALEKVSHDGPAKRLVGLVLRERGIEWVTTEDPGSMFWVANPEAFAHRFGEPYRTRDTGDLDPAGEREKRLLARILPAPRFTFWPADRF